MNRMLLAMLIGLASLAPIPNTAAQHWVDAYRDVVGKRGKIQTPFDPSAADALLAPGNAVIRGRRYVKPRGLLSRKLYAAETGVYLLPMTDYVAEWLARYHGDYGYGLEKISPEAMRYTAAALTDVNGNFEFRNLLPGTYVLLSNQDYIRNGSYRDQIGDVTGYNVYGQAVSSAPIYGPTQYYSLPLTNSLVRVIEIQRDGITVDLGDISNR